MESETEGTTASQIPMTHSVACLALCDSGSQKILYDFAAVMAKIDSALTESTEIRQGQAVQTLQFHTWRVLPSMSRSIVLHKRCQTHNVLV